MDNEKDSINFDSKELEPIVSIIQLLIEKYGLEVINDMSDNH